MELIWVALLVTRVFVMALLRAAVPIVLGLGSAAIAGGFFAGFLRHDSLGGFFSSASGVSVGVLLALIVNGVVRVRNDMVDQIRAGTVALVAVGTLSALAGQLVTGSVVARGILFAATWAGMTAGVLGLVFFIGVREQQPEVAIDPRVIDTLSRYGEVGRPGLPHDPANPQ